MPGTPDRPWLLNPGPCNVSDAVREALDTPDICHREADYLSVQVEVRQLLLRAFELDGGRWCPALITGSGTAALEMAVSSSVSASGAMLVIVNGVYGDRIARMATAHGIETVTVTSGWTEPPDVAAVAAALEAHPEVEVVGMVHHETTTGLVNPVAAVSAVCRAAGKRLLVDTISGLGGEEIDLEGVDIAVCTANKLVQGVPGVSFCLVRRDFYADLRGYPPRSVYLDLGNYLDEQEGGGTPFTPAVQVTYALRQALRELAEETLAGRIARVCRASAHLREGFERLGLEFFLPAELQSNTITTLRLPDGIDYETLHAHMRARGFVIYAGQGDLRREAFRIANMGLLTDEAVAGVLTALEEALA